MTAKSNSIKLSEGEIQTFARQIVAETLRLTQGTSPVGGTNLDNGISQAQTESPGTPMSLTVEEMAKELNISRTTAYALVKQEDFPAFHIGRKVLVNRKGLQRWMDEGGTENVKAC